MDPELAALLSQLTPEDIDALVGAGQTDDRMSIQANAMKMAQAMASSPGAQGAHAGDLYVASSPLEHLAVGLDRIQGQRGVSDARAQMSGLIDQKGGALADAWKRQIAAMQGGAPKPQSSSVHPGIDWSKG